MNYFPNLGLVMFDLDGVLVDACEWHYESLNAALKEFGVKEISMEYHLSTFNGLPTKVKLSMLGVNDETASRINRRKQDKTLEIIRSTAKLDTMKIEMLSQLKREGVKVACVTNSIRETALAMLEATGQMPFIDLLVSNEDVERNKPFPDGYNLAMEKLGVKPQRSLCVEDSPKGLEAAMVCNAKYVWKVDGPQDVCLWFLMEEWECNIPKSFLLWRKEQNEDTYTNGR